MVLKWQKKKKETRKENVPMHLLHQCDVHDVVDSIATVKNKSRRKRRS